MFTKVHLNQEQYLTARRKYRNIEIHCRNVVLIESRVTAFTQILVVSMGFTEIQSGRIPNFVLTLKVYLYPKLKNAKMVVSKTLTTKVGTLMGKDVFNDNI